MLLSRDIISCVLSFSDGRGFNTDGHSDTSFLSDALARRSARVFRALRYYILRHYAAASAVVGLHGHNAVTISIQPLVITLLQPLISVIT